MEEEIKLPKASISKLIKNKFPGKNKFNSNLVDAFNDILNYFINKVSEETNNRLINMKKSKLTGKEVINQLNEIGFKDKLNKLNEDLNIIESENKEKLRKKKKFKIKDNKDLEEKMKNQNQILEKIANKVSHTIEIKHENIYEKKEDKSIKKEIEDFEDF